MKHFVITFWLEECRLRGAAGGMGGWAGSHQMLVRAKSMRDAFRKYAHPAADCYKVEIVPIHYARGLEK